jgi:putative ABC transport system ATP-binding protein
MPPRLSVRGLRSAVGGPFDLDVAGGECVAITGASGSGKSVFLRMIADLDPNEGEVLLDGMARGAMPAPAWRRRVVYAAAEPGWWSDAVETHFPARAAALALAPRLGLTEAHLSGALARLSTGERQRLALIRALTAEPAALLLDEPTGPLDAESTARVETLLGERLAGGLAILLVTHNTEQALRLGHRRLHMAERRLHPA